MPTVATMDELSAVQAGHRLGVSERTVRNMINRGELGILSADPVRLDAGHVDQVLRVRQMAAVADLARRGQTPAHLADQALRILHPPYPGTNLPDHKAEEQRRRMSLVSDVAKTVFGTAALAAAQLEGDVCRWCEATRFAGVLSTWAPERYTEGFAALLGRPCERCGPTLFRRTMDVLAADVRGGRATPSEGRVAPSAAEREAAEEWAQQQARKPVQRAVAPAASTVQDGGRSMVQRRLRDVRARLKDARRRGDLAYALKLQQQLQSLTADASVVDGRAAAARPGTLRCGHALASRCSCPRRASR